MSRKLSDRCLHFEGESLEIPLSKTKMVGLILASVLFVALGFWFLTSFASLQTDFNPLIIRLIGTMSVLFFGATLFYSLKKYFDKSPGLIFTHNGIVDNSNGTSIGLIEWGDIIDVNDVQIWNSKSILLHTDNPEKYIEKANSTQAKIMRANLKFYGTPLCIAPQTLKIDFDELYDMILEEFYTNKKQPI